MMYRQPQEAAGEQEGGHPATDAAPAAAYPATLQHRRAADGARRTATDPPILPHRIA